MLVMTRRKAQELGLKPTAKFVQSVVVGVPAALMGIIHLLWLLILGVAPAYAIPELLEKVGLIKDDIDVYELNQGISPKSWSDRSICISNSLLYAKSRTRSEES